VEITSAWESTIRALIDDPGVTIVIGDTDTGKTAFVHELVSAASRAGLPTAIVDADTGQAEVGPPGVISLAMIDKPFESLREIQPRRMYFVGSTTPVGHMLSVTVGVKKMADEAVSRGAVLVVVDTTGLVKGAMGRKLKLSKIDLLGPRHIVGISKKREIDHILAVLSKIERYQLHRLQASPDVKTKTREFRAARRLSQFYEYFRTADRHIIRLDDIICGNTYFTTGRIVRWQHFRVLERTLKVKVLHAEVVGNGMYVVAQCAPHMAGVDALRNKYGMRDFTVVCGAEFTNLLVGLTDGNFRQRHMAVLTPVSTVTPVRIVQFGYMRVRPDGTELGGTRPGEI
jgi:polynucleotide 5'-hydroxyl-kinase GRC3/NOL9